MSDPEFPVLNPDDTSGGAFEHRPIDEQAAARDRVEEDVEDPSRFTGLIELRDMTNPNHPDVIALLSDTARRFDGIIVEQLDRRSKDGFLQVRLHGGTDAIRDEALTYITERA